MSIEVFELISYIQFSSDIALGFSVSSGQKPHTEVTELLPRLRFTSVACRSQAARPQVPQIRHFENVAGSTCKCPRIMFAFECVDLPRDKGSEQEHPWI